MVDNIKDLEKLLKLCRKQGVTTIEWGTLKLNLGDLPFSPAPEIATEANSDSLAGFPEGILSQEQLMFYSAGGVPENDPYRKD